MRPEDHRFYKNAVALGAKIQDQISPYVFFSKWSIIFYCMISVTQHIWSVSVLALRNIVKLKRKI